MSNDWTNKLREHLADYQEPVKDDLWAAIEQSLAQSQKNSVPASSQKRISESPHARTVVLRRFSIAAAIAAMVVGGTYVYLHPWKEMEPTEFAAITPHRINDAKKYKTNFPQEGIAIKESLSSSSQTFALPKSISSSKETMQTEENEDARKILIAENTPKEGVAMASVAQKETAAGTTTPTRKKERGVEYTTIKEENKKKTVKRMTVNVYGENGLVGNLSGGSQPMLAYAAPVASTCNMHPDFNRDLYESAPMVNADFLHYGEKVKHHQPVSIGMQVGIPITPKVKLTMGLAYTRTSSDYINFVDGQEKITTTQTLHYLGVPVSLSYEVWGTRRFHTYLTGGGEGDVNFKNYTETDGNQSDTKRDRMQWSANVAAGIQYDILPQVGVYLEPGAKYYFDNGSQIENVFKDKKLNFNLQFGLRWNVGKK